MLPALLPPLIAKLCPQTLPGHSFDAEATKGPLGLKREWSQFQVDVKAAGVLFWCWFAVLIAAMIGATYKHSLYNQVRRSRSTLISTRSVGAALIPCFRRTPNQPPDRRCHDSVR
jgi:hypothetical protein